jgi:hypothetical protein
MNASFRISARAVRRMHKRLQILSVVFISL